MDKKIAIAINLYSGPPKQIAVCLRRIAANLPGASVNVIVNGIERPDVIPVTNELGFQTTVGENFGTKEKWPLWWLRMLEYFAGSGADVCFKFDPDTMVDAMPADIPDALYFGCVAKPHLRPWAPPFVQGGVTGLSGEAVRRLLSEKALEPGAGRPWLDPSPDLPWMDDQLIAEALASVGAPAAPWPKCLSQWRCPVLNDPVTHAIVHPRYYGLDNPAVARGFLGTWRGLLLQDRRRFDVVLELSNSEDEAQGVIGHQGIRGMMVDSIEQQGALLTLRVEQAGVAYQAEINGEATELGGQWMCRGKSARLTMRKSIPDSHDIS